MKPRVSRRRTTTGRLGPEQTIEFAAHYSVTFAGSVLQAFAIADRDVSAPVFDQARALQTTRDDGHAGASRAQHLRKEFVRKFELVAFHTIMGHEQPAATTLFNGVKPVAGSKLRELDESARA